MSEFFQQAPELGNQFLEDQTLRSYLRWKLPAVIRAELEPDLQGLGERVVTDILALGRAAEAAPPCHVPFDPWGRRIDRIEVSPAWQELHRVAAEEGLVAIGYDREHGALSRVNQFARLYLFHASSATVTCPLAMTDGAARTLELYGDEALTEEILPHLTTRDPDRFWTSGQWMTERTGGSDVSRTSTVARQEDGEYRLYGTKWFTSATTSEIALTLARPDGAAAGSRGLSLFCLSLRSPDGALHNIRVHRLKDKLGTRALPTAELTLEGTPAHLVGGEGDGVRKIATMLNITRIYNASSAIGTMRRALALARDYAQKREVFGKLLAEQPLHVETLASLEVEFAAAFHLTFRTIELLGKEELGEASAQELLLLRLLTSIVKLYTGKQAVALTSEILECFGGAGYVEDTGLPRLHRDAQVLPIWEGTTNVLSLDVLRTLERGAALEAFLTDVNKRIDGIRRPELAPAVQRLKEALGWIASYLRRVADQGSDQQEAGARSAAYALARIYAASLLVEHAAWALDHEEDHRPLAVAQRWCAQDLTPLVEANDGHRDESRALALGLPLSPSRTTTP